jgi:membrane protease YdiL (CAAX protease family)
VTARAERSAVTGAGLLVALLGPPLVALAFHDAASRGLVVSIAAQCCLILVTITVGLIVRYGERRPLATAGVRRPRPSSFAWAALLAIAYIFVAAPLMQAMLRRFGSPGFASGLSGLSALPVWYRATIVVIGGTIEEFLYRGYAFERLSLILRSRVAAAIGSSIVFAYAHWPLWGFGVSTVLVVPGIAATLFYLWRRDLSANVMAHVVTDLVGIAGA